MNNLTVTLFEEVRKDIKIKIYARITENDELMVDGVDAGELVEKLKGDWDYDYHLKVNKLNKDLLIQKLREDNIKIIDDKELLEWIQANYSGNRAFSSFQSFLTSENIDFETHIWI
ncbi:hypothetical protein GCM10022393_37920 [Aquimarina addita]|uniref:Uncharacterized protein n=1 Tax=Aquimarina addita TaxID=870485 RepID=A0ABP6URY7_9FLAO